MKRMTLFLILLVSCSHNTMISDVGNADGISNDVSDSSTRDSTLDSTSDSSVWNDASNESSDESMSSDVSDVVIPPCVVTSHGEPGAFFCTGIHIINADMVQASYTYSGYTTPLIVVIIGGTDLYISPPLLWTRSTTGVTGSGAIYSGPVTITVDPGSGVTQTIDFTLDPLSPDTVDMPGSRLLNFLQINATQFATYTDAASIGSSNALNAFANIVMMAQSGPINVYGLNVTATTPCTCGNMQFGPSDLSLIDGFINNVYNSLPPDPHDIVGFALLPAYCNSSMLHLAACGAVGFIAAAAMWQVLSVYTAGEILTTAVGVGAFTAARTHFVTVPTWLLHPIDSLIGSLGDALVNGAPGTQDNNSTIERFLDSIRVQGAGAYGRVNCMNCGIHAPPGLCDAYGTCGGGPGDVCPAPNPGNCCSGGAANGFGCEQIGAIYNSCVTESDGGALPCVAGMCDTSTAVGCDPSCCP